MASNQYNGRFTKKSVKARNVNKEPVPMPTPQKTSAPNTIVTVFTALSLCISIIACAFFLTKLGITISLPSRFIADGVTVAGVDVGGLTKNEAIAAVNEAIGDSYTTQALVVSVYDQQLEITPAVSGANLDVKSAVKEARQLGTAKNPAKTVDIIPYLNLNEASIQEQIQVLSEKFPSEGVDGTYDIVKETEGEEEKIYLTTTIGSPYFAFNNDTLYDIILKAYNKHSFTATYECEPVGVAVIDLDAVYEQTCVDAVDAAWDPELHELTEDTMGYRFDLDSAKKALEAAKTGDTLKFPFLEVAPEVNMEALEATLFENELATYTAKSSSSSNRDTNLRLACEALNGLILYPGDVFSYNETLGERTAEKGYKPANSYMGNETIQTYGGGICQPSSALYYCTLIADLEIVQRHSHTFISSYVPYGMDATVDWDGPDFKFSNNTNYPIRIDASADGGSVTISLKGVDEKDYYVEMEYEVLGVSSPSTKEEVVSSGSGHYDGEVKTTAYTGYTIQTYKVKYDKETNEQISREEEEYSVYSKRDQVVYRVTASTPAPTTPTNPPETEPTNPPETEPTNPPETEPTNPPETNPPDSGDSGSVGEGDGDVSIPGEE